MKWNLEDIPLIFRFSNTTIPTVKIYFSAMKYIVVQITSLCDYVMFNNTRQ